MQYTILVLHKGQSIKFKEQESHTAKCPQGMNIFSMSRSIHILHCLASLSTLFSSTKFFDVVGNKGGTSLDPEPTVSLIFS